MSFAESMFSVESLNRNFSS